MNYNYKFFSWENGQKNIEYTDNLIAPIFNEDRLNESLGTAEVVLDCITTKECFRPKSKFRLERYVNDNIKKSWDFVASSDDVESYVGTDGLTCHRINLIEPSVIAQGIHVDNFALTYELQDVTTKYKTYSSDTTNLLVDKLNGRYAECLRETRYDDIDGAGTATRQAYFKNSYAYLWDEDSINSLKNLKLNLEVSREHDISFEIPKLYCYGSTNGQDWDKQLFEVNTVINIYRYETLDNQILSNTKTLILQKEAGPKTLEVNDNEYYYSDGNIACLRMIDNTIRPSASTEFDDIYLRAPILARNNRDFETMVSFKTEPLSVAEIENGRGYYYNIEILAKPVNEDSMLIHYESSFFATLNINTGLNYGRFDPEVKELINPNYISLKAGFNCIDMSQETEYGYLIMKGVKYSCYDLFRKAMLSTDTQIIDNEVVGLETIEYSIILDPKWENRLKTCTIYETTFENKNLWEIFLQIGNYLHAIPCLKFAEDGTDRFMLTFKQLGDTKKNQDSNNKITIFNSQNVNEYFAQYDSYVTNIFSPQNEVDEWIVVTTEDESGLISNDTAILQTVYGISEIISFEITYDGSAGGEAGTKDALSYIFEKSIYEILTADYNISPSKGDSIYYTLGDNKIVGLNYTPPSVNNDMPMALKRIVGNLFNNVQISNLKFNNLKFHIRYRTQDSMRVSQNRPDLKNFLKNSTYEKYPHHEQFFGQQDKIVDSERFSLNLFGKLIRVGNEVYQMQEYVTEDNAEKECGELIEINNEPYYIVEVENEYYPNATFQKVTYSKNYNQLSQIVTIPSEPRFYEVSERSKIRREKREPDYFEISLTKNNTSINPRFLNSNSWQSFIKNIIFNKENIVIPNYSWVRFMVDKKREHRGSYGQYVENNQMFPSSELDRSNPNLVLPKESSDHSDVIVPLLHFPIKDGIIFEYDMEDNFKAGDAVDISISGDNGSVDNAYFAKQSVRYCDIMGRADLYAFRLFNKTDWSYEQAQQLPKACIEPTPIDCIAYSPIDKAIGLDKDAREELSFNYQISLLYQSDFVTFSNLFGNKNSELFCCLLDSEVSMFNDSFSNISSFIIADNINYELVENYVDNCLEIKFNTSDIDLTKVKSVLFYEIDNDNNKVSYLAKNFKNGISGESIPTFYIYPVFNDN